MCCRALARAASPPTGSFPLRVTSRRAAGLSHLKAHSSPIVNKQAEDGETVDAPWGAEAIRDLPGSLMVETPSPQEGALARCVANDRLRHMRIGYTRVSKADGSQSLQAAGVAAVHDQETGRDLSAADGEVPSLRSRPMWQPRTLKTRSKRRISKSVQTSAPAPYRSRHPCADDARLDSHTGRRPIVRQSSPRD